MKEVWEEYGMTKEEFDEAYRERRDEALVSLDEIMKKMLGDYEESLGRERSIY